MTLDEVLAKLDRLLPSKAPGLAAELQPPASREALVSLQAAVAPFEVPGELVSLFSWHNGQSHDGEWPVLYTGPLLAIEDAMTWYKRFTTHPDEFPTWRPSWFPIALEGWSQSVFELGSDGHGLILDASFPEPPTISAPSLTALMHAVCEVLEADISDQYEDREAAYDQTQAIAASVYAGYEQLDTGDYRSNLSSW